MRTTHQRPMEIEVGAQVGFHLPCNGEAAEWAGIRHIEETLKCHPSLLDLVEALANRPADY